MHQNKWPFLLLILSTITVLLLGSACSVPNHQELKVLAGPFEKGNDVTKACLECHAKEAKEFMKTTHWTWKGDAPNMEGYHQGQEVGKMTTINNFCIAVTSNEPRCTQCHAGYGWKDSGFDFENPENIDCLVCHDTSGEYKKDPKSAGMPVEGIDLAKAAKSVGTPTRGNCGFCHFFAGGGDNVKKGDMGTALLNPSAEVDVHMGKLGFSCQKCHTTNKHEIKGSSLHVAVSNGAVSCLDCHDKSPHEENTLNKHIEAVACQTCHIPAFSRAQATKMYWDWSTAGKKDEAGNWLKKEDERGNPQYDYMKGDFRFEQHVKPTYAWWNGKFNRMLIGDSFNTTPVDIASPIGSIEDKTSRIYPFKVMRGKQGADAEKKTLLVPHLFGTGAGANPYWGKWNWEKAFEEGMAAAKLPYSGKYEWVETSMYLAINHEVAPKTMALKCADCHDEGGMDYSALGYKGNPMKSGGRQ